MTTAGSALVFFFKKDISAKVNAAFLGFASGVMVAASVFGLLVPAMEQAENFGKFNWVPAAVGFLAGGAFLIVLDKIVPHAHEGGEHEHGVHAALKKPTKMFLAVTIHNIPEGLAVGFAFGAALAGGEMSSVYAALGLAIGIGIQNFPEGAAVSLPMKNAMGSRSKAFWYGHGERRRGTDIRAHRLVFGGVFKFRHALAPVVCGGRDDLCRGGRSDPRRETGKKPVYRRHRRHARIHFDDDLGRGARLKGGFMEEEKDIKQFFPEAETIILLREGTEKILGETARKKVLSALESMSENAVQMPAFGVSIDELTRKDMQKGVWLRLSYAENQSCFGMDFANSPSRSFPNTWDSISAVCMKARTRGGVFTSICAAAICARCTKY